MDFKPTKRVIAKSAIKDLLEFDEKKASSCVSPNHLRTIKGAQDDVVLTKLFEK